MRILLIESVENKINNMSDFHSISIVHVRNAVIIQKHLENRGHLVKLISHESEIMSVFEDRMDWEVIMFSYASQYMKYNKYLEIVARNMNARYYWLINEHGLGDNIALRKACKALRIKYQVISNNTKDTFKSGLKTAIDDFVLFYHAVNINTLVFDDEKREYLPTLFQSEKQDLIYYGTFRPGRVERLKNFNNSFVLSSSKKNHVKFREAGVEPIATLDKLGWLHQAETLIQFKYSIYTEDEHTSKNYEYLANRFYECVKCDVLMFYADECRGTLIESAVKFDEFQIVKDAQELNMKVNILDENKEKYQLLLSIQRSNSASIMKERAGTLLRIEEILSEVRTWTDQDDAQKQLF